MFRHMYYTQQITIDKNNQTNYFKGQEILLLDAV